METELFKDIKILEFTNYGVGPRTGTYFAQYGARVIKVESANRPDGMRSLPPFHGPVGLNRSMDFSQNNPNKWGVSLNLKNPKGLELAKRLIGGWANIVVENFAPGAMARLGLDYETVKKIKPDIIMLSSCMQGQTGPAASHPGFGYHLSSLAGYNSIVGWPDRDPAGIFGAYTDLIAPLFQISALLAAIDYQRATGKGQYLDVSQYEACIHFLSPLLLDYVINNRVFQPRGNYCECMAPHGVYPCSGDDKWVAIAISTDEEWRNFCKVIGNPKWINEPRFATLSSRIKNRDELDKLVEEWTINYSPIEVMSLMQANGVPAGNVASNEDVWNDPQLRQEGRLCEVSHPETGTCFEQGTSVKLSKVSPVELRHAPLLGEHTEFICHEVLGMSNEEFIQLSKEGVFD